MGDVHCSFKCVTADDCGKENSIGTMNSSWASLVANVWHRVNSATIELVGQQLQLKLVPIVAELVDTPLNGALELLEKPPAWDFGKEKFALDNSFICADYRNQRITHSIEGAFKSAAYSIVESPPTLSIADKRNFVMSFSYYVANTFFE